MNNIVTKIINRIMPPRMPDPIIFGNHKLIKVNEKAVEAKLNSCVGCKTEIFSGNKKGVKVLPCGDIFHIDCNHATELKKRCIKCDAFLGDKKNDVYESKEQYKQNQTILKCITSDCHYAISEQKYLEAKSINECQLKSSTEILKIKDASKTCPYNEINFSSEPGSSKELLEQTNLQQIKDLLVKIMNNKGLLSEPSITRVNDDNSISIRTRSIYTDLECDMDMNVKEYVKENLSAHSAFIKFINDVEKELLMHQLYLIYPEFFIKNASREPRLEGRTNNELIIFNDSNKNPFRISFDKFIDSSKMSFDFDELKQECDKYHEELYMRLFTRIGYDAHMFNTNKDEYWFYNKTTANAIPSGKLPASKFIMFPIV